ncbi:membrane protein [Croceibacterium mercuriale]|uniref:Membrane protein n=1 Tax=Croceibacterium mercuriale TaxID=1572751 RepID=A0A0B2BYY9_9SPHN|nr:MAPEG family protein [Croceibacterium mercuriale]KHL26793.1 membrane protein [Croceibacterium mercuriale]
MPTELAVLVLGAVLLLVHIMLAGQFKTLQYGVEWNAGARDAEMPALNAVAGRLSRAQANFQETFPVAIVALVGVVLAGKTGPVTATAAWVWLAGRVAYLPLYWAGVPYVRSLAWVISTLALVVMLGVLLFR